MDTLCRHCKMPIEFNDKEWVHRYTYGPRCFAIVLLPTTASPDNGDA
jgi:hypothetical protein